MRAAAIQMQPVLADVDANLDAAERLAAGATLVQGYTAFLYRGPLWARQITSGLAARSR